MGRKPKKVQGRSYKVVSDLPICRRIALKIREDIEQTPSHDHCLLKHFKIPEAVTLQSLKCASDDVDNNSATSSAILQKTLFRYFLISDAASPARGIIASILDRLNGADSLSCKSHGIISIELGDFLDSIHRDLNVDTGRHGKDLIVYCVSSNFRNGPCILQRNITGIQKFLIHYMDYLISLHEETSEVSEYDVASGFKCVSSFTKNFLRKCDIDCNDIEIQRNNVTNLLGICKRAYSLSNLEWDSYSAIGMAFVSLLQGMHDDSQVLKEVAKAMRHANVSDINAPDVSSTFHQRMSVCNATLVLLSHRTLSKKLCADECVDDILTEVILPSIKDVDQKCKLISDQLIVAKCYAQWSRIIAIMCEDPEYTQLVLKIQGNGTLGDLFGIAIDKLGHPTDAIRHQANEMLVNMLKTGTNIGSKFFEDLMEKILRQSWKKRSTFTAFNCTLRHVSHDSVFAKLPTIIERLLFAIMQQSLAPYASETYKILAEKSLETAKQVGPDVDKQYEIFIKPLLEVMCQSSIGALQFLVNYCFLKLLKVYGEPGALYTLKSFEDKLFGSADLVKRDPHALAAYLHCLKLSANHAILKDESYISNHERVQDVIKSALRHQNDEIRHIAFSLLCESSRPSTLIPSYALNSLRHALPYNLSCQDSAFRQKLLESIKKMLLRLKSNLLQLQKSTDKDSTQMYHAFLNWLFAFIPTQLDDRSPYMKRITSVTIFQHLADIFRDYTVEGFQPIRVLYTAGSVQSLFILLSDSYPDVREAAYALLTQQATLSLIETLLPAEWVRSIYDNAVIRARKCSQPENCMDAAYHMGLYAVLMSNGDLDRNAVLLKMCKEVLNILKDDISSAKKSLYYAATTSPMYGLMHCLKTLLQNTQFEDMSESNRRKWRDLVSDVISTCFDVSATVLPVVGSVSPEGHLPEVDRTGSDEVHGGSDDAWNELPEIVKSLVIGDGIDHHDECVTRTVSQQILVCCWRSAKESSLLLQELTSVHFPLDSSAVECDGIVSWKQLKAIGEHLRTQLREARHRGAFEITYYVFKAYCPRLWNNKHPELSCIPEKWIEDTLADIQDQQKSKELCATRRSAGLPFFMQALLSGNKSARGRGCLQHVMSTLVNLSQRPREKAIISKVHALNILRGLVKDSSLGEEIFPYVSQCIMAALTGFNSTTWAVRNSSTLLFSALFTRVFGVKRDKLDTLSLKNRLSGNEFFSRLPGLHSFLTECLEKIIANLDLGGHHALDPILHPILLLLSRVFPSTLPTATNTSLSRFVPLLMKCRATAVYKSRVAASVALASVVAWDQCRDTVACCCDNLVADFEMAYGSKAQAKSSRQNRIHGGLLQVKELLVKFSDDESCLLMPRDGFKELVLDARCKLRGVLNGLASKRNGCPTTRSAAIELLLLMRSLIAENCDSSYGRQLEELVAWSIDAFESQDSRHLSGFTFLLEKAARVIVVERPSDTAGLLENVIVAKDTDKLRCLLSALLDTQDAVKIRSDAARLEEVLRDALLNGSWPDDILTLMYRIVTEFASETSAKSLFENSLRIASLCNASQSELSEALIDFQAACIGILTKRPVTAADIRSWVQVVSRSSRSFENADGVRLAVAKSLLRNASVYTSRDSTMTALCTPLWKTLVDLLCDEEGAIRKVASDVVFEINAVVSHRSGISDDHPCIDSVAIRHAFRLMILIHGELRHGECRAILEEFAAGRSAEAVVPVILQGPDDSDSLANEPSLFERSQLNTYYDSESISAAAEDALGYLDEFAKTCVLSAP